MSAGEMIAELPRLSFEERRALAEALQQIDNGGLPPPGNAVKMRQPGLHAGAWKVSADFDDPLPDAFWLGVEA